MAVVQPLPSLTKGELSASSSSPCPPCSRFPPSLRVTRRYPRYIALVVLLGKNDIGVPADWWALSCIMTEIVIGERLFPDDVSLMSLGITAEAPGKLWEKMPEERLSSAGFDMLRGLLQYDPKERPCLLQYDPKERLRAVVALQMP